MIIINSNQYKKLKINNLYFFMNLFYLVIYLISLLQLINLIFIEYLIKSFLFFS